MSTRIQIVHQRTHKLWFTVLFIPLSVIFLTLVNGCISKNTTPPSDELISQHLEGLALLSQHRFKDAEKVLSELVQKSPGSFVPLFNLGVSQLNQAEQGVDNAVLNFEKARRIRPSDPGVPYNLGIIYRFKGDEESALKEFKDALKYAPRDPDCHYQVAIGYLRANNPGAALPHFEMAVQLDPTIRGAWNNLQLMWRRSGRIEEANQALATFKKLEASGRGRAHSTKYTEQGKISEAIRDWIEPSVVLTNTDTSDSDNFKKELLAPEFSILTDAPLALVDSDLDCIPSLWVGGSQGFSLDLRKPEHMASRLPALDGSQAFCVGDVDEDGLVDLIVAQKEHVLVLKGDGTEVPSFTEEICRFPGNFVSLTLADIDMESDLDLLLLDADGVLSLALNEGKIFRPLEESPGLPSMPIVKELIAVRDLDEDGDPDLLLLTSEGLTWISGAPEWNFTLSPAGRPLLSGSKNDPNIRNASLADINGDLREDLMFISGDKLRMSTRNANFKSPVGEALFVHSFPPPERVDVLDIKETFPCDFNNDGSLDMVCNHKFDGDAFRCGIQNPNFVSFGSTEGTILASGDIDGDGDIDLISGFGETLGLQRSLFTQKNPSLHSFRAHLGGRRDGDDRRTNLLGFGTRVELRSPGLATVRYQEGTRGHKARGFQPLVIGVGNRNSIDNITLNWPDGVLQAELNVPTDTCQEIEEVQRKASSCPVLFTFGNGRWNFITDFMGGGGLGFWIGPGEFAPSEPTEVVRIKPDLIEPIDGVVRLSVMEPMQEICYTDRLSLIAVDHPPAQECYPEEYFPVRGAPPSGEPLLIEKSKRTFPTHVYDLEGPVELSKVLESDRVYAGPRSLIPEWVGYCSPQEWIFEFTDLKIEDMNQRSALFLDGWVEYPYSRVNFAAWQGQQRLSAPTISWRKNDASPWNLIGNEFGYPAGMPKTMVLDVSEVLAQGARQFRFASNLELYWDQVFLAPVRDPQRKHVLPLKSALLRDGGYPKEYSDDGRLPATYHYSERQPTLDYRAMDRGHVTRLGRVDELILEADDRFVILGGGDELLLEYDASGLPPLKTGWKRTYMLDTFGWCKDLDPYTAERRGVDPLPFMDMSGYPPKVNENPPDRLEYEKTWNTRSD